MNQRVEQKGISYLELMKAQDCAYSVFSYCKNGNAPIPQNATDAEAVLLAALRDGFTTPASYPCDQQWIEENIDLIVEQIGFFVEEMDEEEAM